MLPGPFYSLATSFARCARDSLLAWHVSMETLGENPTYLGTDCFGRHGERARCWPCIPMSGPSVCANNFLHGLVSHRLRALIGTANAKSHTPNSWQAWRSRHGLLASLACKYRASYERHRKQVCGKQRNRKTHSLSSSHHWTSVQLHCNSVTKAGEPTCHINITLDFCCLRTTASAKPQEYA